MLIVRRDAELVAVYAELPEALKALELTEDAGLYTLVTRALVSFDLVGSWPQR